MLKLFSDVSCLYVIGQIGGSGERVKIVLDLAYWRSDWPLRQVRQEIVSVRTSLQRYSSHRRTAFASPADLAAPYSD